MIISFRNRKLQKLCESEKELRRTFGQGSRKVAARLAMLDAADCLEDLREAPGRCHELTADRQGQLSLDVEHPLRLIFEPRHDPRPVLVDGGLDWRQVTEITILELVDTHD